MAKPLRDTTSANTASQDSDRPVPSDAGLKDRPAACSDDFEMDCWEPSLLDKLRNATKRKK